MSNSAGFAQHQAGLSLLEVLIATVILSAGLLGLAGLQVAGMKTTHNSFQMQQATWQIQELLEKMRANKTEVMRVDNTGNPASTYLLTTRPSTYCLANPLTPSASIAQKDIYQVLCGANSTSSTSNGGGMINTLMNSQISITCPNGNSCRKGVQVALQWTERNASQRATDFASGVNGEDNTDGEEVFSIRLNAIL